MSDSAVPPEVFQFCPWEAFDAAWYAATHLRHLGGVDPHMHYRLVGIGAGHAPNRYFDEGWYLRRYPAVAERVRRGVFASGFAHYREVGFRTHDPHWLFSESRYRGLRQDLADAALSPLGLRNGYHHYLIAGQNEGVSGSAFFDAGVFAESTAIVDQPFSALLATPELATLRLSRYFDQEWYLAVHAEAAALVAGGTYSSALHHYLASADAVGLAGSADFDEAFYAGLYPDVARSIATGVVRNGYQHFLDVGRFEGRRPSPWFDPGHYARHRRVAVDMATSGLTLFDHYVLVGRGLGLTAVAPAHLAAVEADSEAAAKVSFARMAHVHAAATLQAPAGMKPVRFAPVAGAPDVSVVIAAFNQFDLTVQTLLSLSGSVGVTFEVILVDNGSTDEVRRIEAHVPGLRVLRNAENAGFLHASNQGIAACLGVHVLLLNNDVIVQANTLAAAVGRLVRDPGVGAVGGMLVRTHGRLQEAGSMLFQDASACGYGRDGDPAAGEYNFVRDVDYCSGAFLLVRGALLRALGGLDPVFAPAYYEETDLCVRIWKHGFRVVYDPQVVVVHLEYGSSRNPLAPLAQMRRNQAVFLGRHREWLAAKQKPDPALFLAGRITQGAGERRRRVLVIEDTIPYRHIGSGFVRTADVVASLVSLGWQVTVFPMNPMEHTPPDLRAGFDDTVELLWDHDVTDVARVFAERELLYDAVWVCRAHNLHRLAGVVGQDWGPLRHARVVLDTEALACNREAALAVLEGRVPDLARELTRELSQAGRADVVVAVSALEAAQMRAEGVAGVCVLGHAVVARPTARDFDDRADVLALGSLYGSDTPNFDGLRWFIAGVWPLVRLQLPAARLLVAGYVSEGLDAAGLLAGAGVEHLGYVADVAALYDRVRVFVAPTRFSAGIPYKVHEAAAHGVPVVACTQLADQLGWADGIELMAREASDAEAFAAAVVACHVDATLWGGLRERALARISVDCDGAAFVGRVAEIVSGLGCERPTGAKQFTTALERD